MIGQLLPASLLLGHVTVEGRSLQVLIQKMKWDETSQQVTNTMKNKGVLQQQLALPARGRGRGKGLEWRKSSESLASSSTRRVGA